MAIQRDSHPTQAYFKSSAHITLAVLVVFVLSYLASELGGLLALRPQMIWPLWPGCAFLVAVLLISPRKLWPALLGAGFLAFALYDIREGLTISGLGVYLLADAVEVLVAALGVSYIFHGAPRLSSVGSLLKYSIFAVVLAPVSTASLTASTLAGQYHTVWRIAFLTEALALLTITPAILSWRQIATAIRARKASAHYFEVALMIAGLVALAYYAFVAPGSQHRPEWLYSLVPFLLWAALRFGIVGTSNALIVVAFLAILGTIHGHGPFTGSTAVQNVVSLQAFLLFAAGSFMVLAALVEDRKLAAETLRESEEKFRSVFRDAGMGMVIVSPSGRFLAANRSFCDCLGYTEDELLAKTVESVTLAEDWPVFSQTLNEVLTQRTSFHWVQKRCLHKSGRIVHTESSASVIRSRTGDPQYLVGEVLDITKRKEAEEALSIMNQRLIEAQEQERTRIARELHDDINQRLALLSVELEAHRKNPPKSAEGLTMVLTDARERINELSYDVQSISHQLHSSKLEYLGLVAAAKSFCQELAHSHQLEVNFAHDNVPRSIPYDVSLSLFRVLQEALHNALKHSQMRHFEVRMGCFERQLHLTVSDCGVGFDSDAARAMGGLGLISMRERVRLVNGTIAIDTKPMGGTTIRVRVPLDSDHAQKSGWLELAPEAIANTRLNAPRRFAGRHDPPSRLQRCPENTRREYQRRVFA